MLEILFVVIFLVVGFTLANLVQVPPKRQPTAPWKILKKYGELLTGLKASGRCVHPDKLLPYPRMRILQAFESALKTPIGKEKRVMLENSRAFLASFVPADQVPRDLDGDMIYLESVLSKDPVGQRILASIRVRSMGVDALAERLNAMSGEERAELYRMLKIDPENLG